MTRFSATAFMSPYQRNHWNHTSSLSEKFMWVET